MKLFFLLMVVQDVPAEYREAERAARATLEMLGVSTHDVEVRYEDLGSRLHGDQLGRTIRVNPKHFPESVKTIYHEFWHYYQQERFGRYFHDVYHKYRYATNPFEHEARIFAEHMDHLVRGRRMAVVRAESFEGQVATTLELALPEMRKGWIEASWASHLETLEARLGTLPRAPLPGTILRRAAAREAGGLCSFAAAYLLKEAMNGRPAWSDLNEPRFWGNVALFSVAARGAEKLPLKGLARSTVPLAVGMAALQLLSGNFSPRDLAISTGSFLAAGAAVNLLADRLVFPALFAAGPPGWAAVGVYTVGKLAVTLYVGEKLEGWIHKFLGERGTSKSKSRDGIQTKVESIGESP